MSMLTRHIVAVLLVGLAVFTGCSAPQNPNIDDGAPKDRLASSDLDTTIVMSDFDTARANAAIFYATNEARAAEGLAPVEHHALLEELATDYAARLADLGEVSHDDPKTGATPKDRFAAAGISNPLPSENLATNVMIEMRDGEELYPIDVSKGLFSREPGGEPVAFRTYASLGRSFVESWLNSPGHRRNLLAEEAVQLGAGVAVDTRDQFSAQFPVVVGVQKFQNYEPLQTE
jgi:uncharacterized protein YkwD